MTGITPGNFSKLRRSRISKSEAPFRQAPPKLSKKVAAAIDRLEKRSAAQSYAQVTPGVAETQSRQASVRDLVAETFSCSREIADRVVGCGRLRQFQHRAVILRRGDRLTLAYLLAAGRAQALLYSAEGQAILLHDFRRGDWFGALGELITVHQDADVLAVGEADTLTLEAAAFARLAEQHGEIGLALSRMLMARLRQTSSRMYERAALSAVGRVYAELLREAQLASGYRISPAPVVAELALRVSTTRETASRALSALERRGIIRRDASSLAVVAPHRLEELII